MPSSQGSAPKAGGSAKRSAAAIQRRKQKGRARSKVKKLREEGAAVPKALALAARPAKPATPRVDKANGFAAKLLAVGQEPADSAASPGAAGSTGAGSASAAAAQPVPSEWCKRGALARFPNRRIGKVIADPDSDSEVKLRWVDDGGESRFIHINQLEYVAADVEEYVAGEVGEKPVRKPHKKAARKAAREAAAAAVAAVAALAAPPAAATAATAPAAAPAAAAGETPADATQQQGTAERSGETEEERRRAKKRRKKAKQEAKRKKE
jgi:hypothetical protein